MENSIGGRICEYRQLRKLTQEEFAARLGVTPQAVSKWERGNGLPDVSLLGGICRVLEVSADTMIGLEKPVVENGNASAEKRIKENLLAEPVVLEFGQKLISAVGEGLKKDLVNTARKLLARRKGYLLPIMRIRDNMELNEFEYRILVYDKVFYREVLEEADQAFERMLEQVIRICEERYDAILNKQVVKTLIDNLKEQYPGVAEGVVPEKISYLKVMQVLREKAEKQESIRDMIHILEELEGELE